MANYLKMLELKKRLDSMGHKVILPSLDTDDQLKEIVANKYVDTHEIKIKYNYIRKHYSHIVEGDCVLIANYDKNSTKNYVGGNSFLEMGYAYSLNKPIYLLNPVPEIEFYYHEMVAMQPIILNGKLELIG